jgi:hypothetical protein
MGMYTAILLIWQETIAYGEVDELPECLSLHHVAAGIGKVGLEVVPTEVASILTIQTLSFTDSGLRVLGHPSNLYEALVDKEFIVRILRSDDVVAEYHCNARALLTHATVAVRDAVHERVEFWVCPGDGRDSSDCSPPVLGD